MRIYFKAEDLYDSYLCFEFKGDQAIILPENISSKDFLLFLQGSLEQIRPVLIFKKPEARDHIDLASLKSTHYTFNEQFLFLNYSIRNSLKVEFFNKSLKSFEDIRDCLQDIFKK